MKTEILLKACPITPKMLKDADLYETRRGDKRIDQVTKEQLDKKFTEFRKPPSNKTVLETLEKFDSVRRHNLRYVDIVDASEQIMINRYGMMYYLTSSEEDHLSQVARLELKLEEISKWSRFDPMKYISLYLVNEQLDNLKLETKFTRIYNSYTREWWLDVYHE